MEFRAGEARLAADRWPGRDPTIVLLHSGVTDRRSWCGSADLLAEAGTAVAYDRRGYGRGHWRWR